MIPNPRCRIVASQFRAFRSCLPCDSDLKELLFVTGVHQDYNRTGLSARQRYEQIIGITATIYYARSRGQEH